MDSGGSVTVKNFVSKFSLTLGLLMVLLAVAADDTSRQVMECSLIKVCQGMKVLWLSATSQSIFWSRLRLQEPVAYEWDVVTSFWYCYMANETSSLAQWWEILHINSHLEIKTLKCEWFTHILEVSTIFCFFYKYMHTILKFLLGMGPCTSLLKRSHHFSDNTTHPKAITFDGWWWEYRIF